MSRSEWERGTIKLSSKEFTRVRAEMVRWYNERMDALFEKAKQIREAILKEGAGKRGFSYLDAADRLLGFEKDSRIKASLFRWKGDRKPFMPRRKDFPRMTAKLAAFSCDGEAYITFHKSTRTVVWDVPENNHAVDHARETPEAQKFFRLLSSVVWTRGTGGTIVGNDEYNEESREAGGGGNYVVERYGPDVKKPVLSRGSGVSYHGSYFGGRY